MRLGKYKRDSDSLAKEGENLQAVWSPDAKLIAVLVSVPLISHVVISLILISVKVALGKEILLCIRSVSSLVDDIKGSYFVLYAYSRLTFLYLFFGRHLLSFFTFSRFTLPIKKYKLEGSSPLDCFLLPFLFF